MMTNVAMDRQTAADLEDLTLKIEMKMRGMYSLFQRRGARDGSQTFWLPDDFSPEDGHRMMLVAEELSLDLWRVLDDGKVDSTSRGRKDLRSLISNIRLPRLYPNKSRCRLSTICKGDTNDHVTLGDVFVDLPYTKGVGDKADSFPSSHEKGLFIGRHINERTSNLLPIGDWLNQRLMTIWMPHGSPVETFAGDEKEITVKDVVSIVRHQRAAHMPKRHEKPLKFYFRRVPRLRLYLRHFILTTVLNVWLEMVFLCKSLNSPFTFLTPASLDFKVELLPVVSRFTCMKKNVTPDGGALINTLEDVYSTYTPPPLVFFVGYSKALDAIKSQYPTWLGGEPMQTSKLTLDNVGKTIQWTFNNKALDRIPTSRVLDLQQTQIGVAYPEWMGKEKK